MTHNTITFEDGDAWVKFTRTPEGTLAVDSYLEIALNAAQVLSLNAWLSWHAIDMPSGEE